MDKKRILTTIIGLPAVILIMIFGTPQIINFMLMLIAIICMNEYFKVISKICNPIKWIGYLSTIIIFITSFIKIGILYKIILFSTPMLIFILFLHVVLTDMKKTFKDVAYTFLGIAYITGFIMFLGLITSTENGNYLLIYTIITAWFTDIFAYLAGKHFGKHKFSKISPKKTIEGCVVGAISSTIAGILYVFILDKIQIIGVEGIEYLYIGIITCILSAISQIGDFTASSIKRFADTKDYGSIIPGHGGMLDRVDSLIFIAPFVYMIIQIINF